MSVDLSDWTNEELAAGCRTDDEPMRDAMIGEIERRRAMMSDIEGIVGDVGANGWQAQAPLSARLEHADGVITAVEMNGVRYVPRGDPARFDGTAVLRTSMTAANHLRVSVDPDAPNGTTATYEATETPESGEEPWRPNIIINTDNGPVPFPAENLSADLRTLGQPLAQDVARFRETMGRIANDQPTTSTEKP